MLPLTEAEGITDPAAQLPPSLPLRPLPTLSLPLPPRLPLLTMRAVELLPTQGAGILEGTPSGRRSVAYLLISAPLLAGAAEEASDTPTRCTRVGHGGWWGAVVLFYRRPLKRTVRGLLG